MRISRRSGRRVQAGFELVSHFGCQQMFDGFGIAFGVIGRQMHFLGLYLTTLVSLPERFFRTARDDWFPSLCR